MKQTFYSILILVLAVSCDNSSKKEVNFSSDNFINNLDSWTYYLDKNPQTDKTDSIKPIAEISFWRTKPIDESLKTKIQDKLWTPRIDFEIFSLADSGYCRMRSNSTRLLSSCVPPNVGGDIFILGSYIFLNHKVCLQCGNYETGVDYCRPIIQQLVNSIDKTKTKTIDDIVGQFKIKRSDKKASW